MFQCPSSSFMSVLGWFPLDTQRLDLVELTLHILLGSASSYAGAHDARSWRGVDIIDVQTNALH